MTTSTRPALSFTREQRAELLVIGVAPAQIVRLEAALHMLQHFARVRPSVDAVRDALVGLQARAQQDIRELETLSAALTPAKQEAAAMLAYFLEREPDLFEPPWHPQPATVLAPEIERAKRMSEAVSQAVAKVQGRRQHQVSPWAVGIIHGALEAARATGARKIPLSYAEGSAFSRIVSICMGAAGGDENRTYERWIKAYKTSMKDGIGGDPDDGLWD